MVISFSHDTPWEHLIKNEEVVTFRKSRRKNPNCQTWCNRGRGQSKEFDVQIREIGKVEPTRANLSQYVDQSGFNSAKKWQSAIAGLNGEVPEYGWLYIVMPDADFESASPPSIGQAP